MIVPSIISDGMVLQRNAEVRIWGEASPGERVSVSFRGKEVEVRADDAGKWIATLEPMEAGGPWEMRIQAGDEERIIRDVLIGEVWLLGGQSNMELPVRRTFDLFEEEIRATNEPHIRQFTVPQRYDFHGPREDLPAGQWIAATQGDIENLSAAGFFFARELRRTLGVPIGLIATAQGGTPIEAWMSEPTLRRIGGYDDELDRIKDDAYVAETKRMDEQRGHAWYRDLNERDLGLKEAWHSENCNTDGWSRMHVPDSWRGTDLDSVQGAIWFRREFDVPESMAGAAGMLKLGTIVDADDTYVNGERVGNTPYRYPPRRYPIRAGLLKAGKNTIAVRIIVNGGTGEFIRDMPYELIAGGQSVQLDGEWKFRIGAVSEPAKPSTFFQYKPAGLYNGMIAPLANMRIQGALWYQGESNAGRPAGYRDLFREMARDWRTLWGIGDFPIVITQLANFDANRSGGTGWAELREEQRQSLAVPNTALAVAIDLGQYNELHPQDKKTLGQRLALCARKTAYGEDIVYSGPMVRAAEPAGNEVRVKFDHVGSGLVARGGELRGFEVCGDDGQFMSARAVIAGDDVIVACDQVHAPREVRYAWADDPTDVGPGANLYNAEGLPASPFKIAVS